MNTRLNGVLLVVAAFGGLVVAGDGCCPACCTPANDEDCTACGGQNAPCSTNGDGCSATAGTMGHAVNRKRRREPKSAARLGLVRRPLIGSLFV